MPRKSISPRVRFEVLRRDGFACIYCGAVAPVVQLVIDHIQPYSKGGADSIGNYATACQPCNAGKGASDVVPREVPDWYRLADRILEASGDNSKLGIAIAAELATLTENDGPTQGMSAALLAGIGNSGRLRRLLSDEDPFSERFSFVCWLEVASYRQESGMPSWRPRP